MTIIVATVDDGLKEFDANDWNEDPATGSLWVGDRASKEGVAQFAKGSWLYVYEKKPKEKGMAPRRWNYPHEIPDDEHVIIKDADGVLFTNRHDHRGRIIYPVRGGYKSPVGPLVEVL